MVIRICKVDGCSKNAFGGALGMCPMHYRRKRVHGTLREPELIDNFTRYELDPETGCWTWTGPNDGKGYGFFSRPFQGEKRAHRAFWVRSNGPIAQGLELDHLCRNRSCVNPDHLEAVTHYENMQRARLGQWGTETCRSGKHDVTGLDAWKVFPSSQNRYCRACYEESYRRGLVSSR